MRGRLLAPLVATALLFSTGAGAGTFSVLVYSRTTGFRHASIPDGIAAIQALGAANGFTVEATEDPAAFTQANLARFAAVIFLLTTGDVLDATQEAAFEAYIRDGGGWAGVHSAADTEYTWAWYDGLLGAHFKSHPSIQTATIVVEDATHVSTAHLPARWTRTDEWYNFQTNPRAAVHVLATLDETTYAAGLDAMGDHPIAWCHVYDGGRAWYTAAGHTAESYADPDFRTHLLGGIQSAAGLAPGPCGGATASTVPGATTTTTTLPGAAAQPLAGHRLRVEREPRGATLTAVARDRRVTLDGDPTALGGTLRVATAGTVALELPLPARNWRRLAGTRGFRYTAARGDGVVSALRVRPGRGLRAAAHGPELAALLASDPGRIVVTADVGGKRYCVHFGLEPAFRRTRLFRARGDKGADACP
jgi:type 1 glutamine amidotransferase